MGVGKVGFVAQIDHDNLTSIDERLPDGVCGNLSAHGTGGAGADCATHEKLAARFVSPRPSHTATAPSVQSGRVRTVFPSRTSAASIRSGATPSSTQRT